MTLLVMFGSEQGMFAKFQNLPMYALRLLTIILVGREAACFVLWFMKGGKKENMISCCLGFA
jgi:hypothetical protein